MRFTVLFLVLFLVVLSSISCRAGYEPNSTAASFEPLEPRTERSPICGIESFNSKADPLCGIKLYKKKRSHHCPVELFKEKASLSCPGSRPEQSYNVSSSGACRRVGPGDFTGFDAERIRCRNGYQLTQEQVIRKDCSGTYIDSRRGRCVIPEIKPTCRLEQFGVERYKNCRHSNHGVESYNTCAREEFGVRSYKKCDYFLETSEVERYINATRNMIDFMAKDLVTHMGNFYYMASDQIGLGCMINRLRQDPLYEDLQFELEQYYNARFEGAPSSLDCSTTTSTIDINTYTCPVDDSSSICNTVRQYRLTKSWFTSRKQDVVNLRSDHAARADSRIRRLLEQLHTELEKKD